MNNSLFPTTSHDARMIRSFISFFQHYNGYFEFSQIIQDQYIKVLFYAKENCNHAIIEYCRSMLWETPTFRNIEKLIMKFSHIQNFHIWIAPWKQWTRLKIYFPTYSFPLHAGLSILSSIQHIYGDTSTYFFSPSCSKIDTIWIDIYESLIDIKVYELLDHDDILISSLLPNWLTIRHIREYGCVHGLMSERKKLFFRLDESIPMHSVYPQNNILNWMTNNLAYMSSGNIRYYCRENGKEEIYFT